MGENTPFARQSRKKKQDNGHASDFSLFFPLFSYILWKKLQTSKMNIVTNERCAEHLFIGQKKPFLDTHACFVNLNKDTNFDWKRPRKMKNCSIAFS